MNPQIRRRRLHFWMRRLRSPLPSPRFPGTFGAFLFLTAALLPGSLLARRFVPAFMLTAALATVAQWLKAVTPQGAVAGAAASMLLFLGGGPGAFAGLTAVFFLASISTRAGYGRKHRLGLAESREGRSASQVLANTGAAALLAVLALFSTSPALWLAAAAAAMAEAAADTVSSELGQMVGGPTYLMVNLRAVAPGTNGGVSLAGTLAGMLAAGIVAGTCATFGVITSSQVAVVVAAAIVGMFADSLLGATAEPRGLLSNNGVNLAGTLVAAGAAFVICNW
ncbi:MAG: DUF92 domain-containing protein [Acidobacteria bacterium]|nr:DUF92 domain-containing protein [Acidobacteriota bacterium]